MRGQRADPKLVVYNLCYLPVLRRPPQPSVVNDKKDVLVTIDTFWLDDYWRELKPSDLTLHYNFPVSVSEERGVSGGIDGSNKG